MAFSSIHTRLTRTSSDLRQLSAVLLPPSPILEVDDLLISSTSRLIPILLEATTPPPCRTPSGLWNLGEERKITDKPTRDTPRDLPHEANWMNITAEQNNCQADSPGDSLTVGVSRELKITHPTYCDFPGGDTGRPSILGVCSPSALRLRDPQTSCPNATGVSSTTVVSKEDLDGDQPPTVATFPTYSTLPTPTFAAPSPSPSTDVISPSSSSTGRQRHRRPLERARAVRFPGRPKSPRLQVDEVEAHPARNTPPPRWQLAGSAPHPCTTATVHPFVKHVALPAELSWLRHTLIELWIDQEGFRAVRSCMQLIGYSPRTRSLRPYESSENAVSDVTAGIAEFMPTKRETFVFHYAALDSPPALRMVSTAGDESRDYISRQATLSVKVNGVYTVLGTETLISSVLNNISHGSRLQNVRLRWKFDYLVSDRKVDGTGKILPGEKTLTPLTFSCSPYLLHPLQGKKSGLMHIMRKNLVSKLGSQKVEPPTWNHASSRSVCQRDVATHARSHSDAFAKGRQHTRSPLVSGVEVQDVDCAQRARRRRASSAGEDGMTCLRNEPAHGAPESLRLA